ncbi:MAG: hypothetical protein HW391_1164 [Chloroflexi bacterium]|nr:hypothetical protein [Chloroflexota bacterium]
MRLPAGRLALRLDPIRIMVLAVSIVSGCGSGTVATATSGPISPAPPPNAPIEGVIVHVESTGLDSVTGFTLRTADGSLLEFRIGQLATGAEFPPGHLTEHQATAEPVRITYVKDGETLVATGIEDAGG